MADDSSFVTVKVQPDPGFTLVFNKLSGTEELGRPFLIDLTLASTTAKPDLTSLLGSSVTVAMTLPDKSKRYFNGVITRASYLGIAQAGYGYHFELRPQVWLLSRKQDCKIFQNKTVWQIITGIFSDASIDVSDKRQNATGSQTLEYCVQYNETSLDFVTRLMEVYGLYYFFTHADGKHTLVMADDPNSHTSIGKALPYQFRQTEVRTVEDHVWNWQSDTLLQPDTATFRDYNFTTPANPVEATSQQPGSQPKGKSKEIYEYPGAFGTQPDGTTIANVVSKHFATDQQRFTGDSNARALVTGCRFTLSGFPDTSQNQEYIVVSTSYAMGAVGATQATQGAVADALACGFKAIPATVNFCLPCSTRWPVMRGPQTAKVVGNSGDEITTDQYGRIKVQFPWDRDGKNDQNSSCFIRVAQMWTGLSWGSIFIPRVGQEVVVDFLDGNPDRPLVTGCVYNATNTVPYALDANKTRSTIKTNSSTGGGGFNELRFEDKKGSEEVFLQAQKDLNVNVLNNESITISNSSTTTIDKSDRSVTLNSGNDSLTISKGNHSVAVSAGTSTLNAAQGITLESNQSITLMVGSNSITISTTGITMSCGTFSLSATESMSANGGQSMTLQATMININ